MSTKPRSPADIASDHTIDAAVLLGLSVDRAARVVIDEIDAEILRRATAVTRSSLKAEAKELAKKTLAATGKRLKHSAALEIVSVVHGFRNWQTARASLPP